MNIRVIPKPLVIAGGVLILAFLGALVLGVSQRPEPAPVEAPAASVAAPPAPQQPAHSGSTPLPTAQQMPAPSASESAPSTPSATGAADLAGALRPPAFFLDSTEAAAMHSGHMETVKLNSDPFSSSVYSTILARESRSGSQSTLDGPAARSAANLPDVDGVQVSKRGYIRIDVAGAHDLMLQSASAQSSWLSHAECVVLLGGVSVTRTAPARISAATVSLAAGWHELELTCTRMTGVWQSTLAIRAPGAEAPQIQALSIPSRAQSRAEPQSVPAVDVAPSIDLTEVEPSAEGAG
jgi:hypothetical protein